MFIGMLSKHRSLYLSYYNYVYDYSIIFAIIIFMIISLYWYICNHRRNYSSATNKLATKKYARPIYNY